MVTKQYTGHSFIIRSSDTQNDIHINKRIVGRFFLEYMNDPSYIKDKFTKDDYISALREMGIEEKVLEMMEAPCTLTEAEIEDVKKWEDG